MIEDEDDEAFWRRMWDVPADVERDSSHHPPSGTPSVPPVEDEGQAAEGKSR